MAGGVHPEPIEGCRALPQGNPWGPIGSLAVLAAPASHVEQALGGRGLQIVYLDDRSGYAESVSALRSIL
eukprot:13438521-Alexandrium_andersonii.AAC.1